MNVSGLVQTVVFQWMFLIRQYLRHRHVPVNIIVSSTISSLPIPAIPSHLSTETPALLNIHFSSTTHPQQLSTLSLQRRHIPTLSSSNQPACSAFIQQFTSIILLWLWSQSPSRSGLGPSFLMKPGPTQVDPWAGRFSKFSVATANYWNRVYFLTHSVSRRIAW